MGDADGWKRGALGIDGVGNPGLRRQEDYMFHSPVRSAIKLKTTDAFDGFSGALPKGGEPRHAPKSSGPAFNPGKRIVPKPTGKFKSRGI